VKEHLNSVNCQTSTRCKIHCFKATLVRDYSAESEHDGIGKHNYVQPLIDCVNSEAWRSWELPASFKQYTYVPSKSILLTPRAKDRIVHQQCDRRGNRDTTKIPDYECLHAEILALIIACSSIRMNCATYGRYLVHPFYYW